MDFGTLLGLAIGIGGILLGNVLEDGHTSSLVQATAGLIVFGGTLGATLVANTVQDLKTGLALLKWGFLREDDTQVRVSANEIIELAKLARRESILALEARLPGLSSDWTRNVFRFLIDGADAQTLRDIFEPEIANEEERLNAGAKIWSDAGGFAPTIGIIGAVLGLIHVMGNLTNTAALGQGIAVAFVATIYGIASANLFFIPISHKIRRKVGLQAEQKRMVLEGAVAILSGLNPYIIEEKMKAYVDLDTERASA